VGAFTDSVDQATFTIQNQPNYIFLCGGPLRDFDHSLRAHFYRDRVEGNPDLKKRVQLAETADQWYQSRKLFEDLLEMEEYLAGLSACILLFVESPGAIAEFGAFSQMKLLQDKLVVVVEDSHFHQQSFIRNGLIEHALRMKWDILSYPWLAPSLGSGPRKIDIAGATDTLDQVEKEIEQILAKRPKRTPFQADDHGHLMLLIADLVALNVIASKIDLQEQLRGIGLRIEHNQLKKYLFLLDRLQLISAFQYGHSEYYINVTGGPDYVHYGPRPSTDRARLRTLIREEFPMTPEKEKALAASRRRLVGVLP